MPDRSPLQDLADQIIALAEKIKSLDDPPTEEQTPSFAIGDTVETLPDWSGGPLYLRGAVETISDLDTALHGKRTHKVKLEQPWNGHRVMWFDPADLQHLDARDWRKHPRSEVLHLPTTGEWTFVRGGDTQISWCGSASSNAWDPVPEGKYRRCPVCLTCDGSPRKTRA